MLKFAKYLPQFGWNPIILTAREQDYVLKDDSPSSEIPKGIQVVRTPAPDLYRWYDNIGKKRNTARADLSAIAVSRGRGRSFSQRLALFIRSFLFVPDARIAWLPFALSKALRIVKIQNIDAVMTSSPPFTTALIGGFLSRLTNLPWISDYRDPWTQAYFYFRRPQPSRWIENTMEQQLLRRASRLVSINDRINEGLRTKYNLHHDDKWIIIPNGYDPEDFKDIEPIIDGFFNITYTGTLHAKMHPGPLLEAAEQLCLEQPEFAKKVRLNFIGRIGDDVAPMFRETPISSKIRTIPHIPHYKCLRYTTGADLLLLLIPPSSGYELIMTGKLFEYLRSGRPILCLAETGEAAEIIQKANAGYPTAYEDIGKIKQILLDTYKRWAKNKGRIDISPDWDYIEQFDRKKGTQTLANVLNEIIK